ncbi:gibberellin cluster-GA4-Desaturase [Fusarium denticulatum]|uniref:Gibberellin cluster-GA4-Desaturase n=1 Tax=Fusarium denticulatum TaxID=48507 RepID=A0A8H5SW58_9HYPO|nr:gibberellin cluster-GA4-Desaturase [Fusarium denticulatum]
MCQSQTAVGTTAKSVTVSIPYYEGPINPPDHASSLTTSRFTNWQPTTITDVRPSVSNFTLDKNGFQYVKHASALSSPPHTLASWKDPKIREKIYDAEIIELAKSVTGARKVMILLATGRNAGFVQPENETARPDIYVNHTGSLPATRMKGFYDGRDKGTVRRPHVDWGTGGIRSILRQWSQELADEARDIIEAEDEAARLPGGIAKNYKGRRWGFYNTWRPLKPVRRDPLACVDYFTTKDDKHTTHWMDMPGINGPFRVDTQLTAANSEHKWYWLSDQQPDDVLFIRFFDSKHERDPDNVAGGTHHCSFHLPGTDDEEVRESMELKFIAFW